MSSILKALKRLEEQKAVRRDVDHDMEWVGVNGAGRAGGKRRWPTMAALTAVALVSVVSTYWLTDRGGDRRQPASPAVEGTIPPGAAPLDAPVSPPSQDVPRETVLRPPAPSGRRPVVVSPAPSREAAAIP